MMKNIRGLLAFGLFAVLLSTQAQAACWQWSRTTASNATADPTINWAEGMSPSSVNDSARAMMARLAECRDDLSGLLVTTGTSTAYAVTTNQGLDAVPQNGQQIVVRLNVTNGAAATLTADGGTTYPIQTAPSVAVASGVLIAGTPYRVMFNSSVSAWILQDFYNSTLAPDAIGTTNIQDGAVVYRKFQKPSTTSRLIGTPSIAQQTISTTANNGSGLVRLTVASTTGYVTGDKKSVTGVVGTTEANGYWTITVVDATHIDLQGSTYANAYVSGGTIGGYVEEISLGAGLAMTANVLSAPAFPPPGTFRNLAIKVASNTTATVTADWVSTTNGTLYQTTAVSCTINFASTGINALDFGSIASSTWYYIWINATASGTTGCTASLQSTANATFLSHLPSTYTYYGRVGAVRTASGSAQLMGTWQFADTVQYVVGLAQTSDLPALSGSSSSAAWTTASVSSAVPPTASSVHLSIYKTGAGGNGIIAPNSTYTFGGTGAPMPPISVLNGMQVLQWLVLESSNIYVSVSSGGGTVTPFVLGWKDNL